MSSKKHHPRAREREPATDQAPARGRLARVFDRVRAWFGDRDAIRRLRLEAERMGDAVREQFNRSARRGGRYPIGTTPAPQGWPWRFQSTGRFAGRGPRNYIRPDDRILEDIHETLTYSPHIDASDIEVRVEQGEVIVLGTVDDRFIKRLVEDLIHDVPGVRDLQNQLRVGRSELHGPGGMSRGQASSDVVRRIRGDVTAGHERDEVEGTSLNTGTTSCREDERGTSSSPGEMSTRVR